MNASLPAAVTSAAATWENPMGTDGFEFIEYAAPDPAARYRSEFHADRVCFSAEWPTLHAHTTVWVSPEDDIELRRVELTNHGEATIEIELLSALDITLATPAADEAHPAFSNLFVQADWLPAQQALRLFWWTNGRQKPPRIRAPGGPPGRNGSRRARERR